MPEVIVLGAGIVGLTTALQLRATIPSLRISVLADKFTTETTSDGAAGIFRPSTSFSGPTPEITRKWINDSYEYYKNLLQEPKSGVSKISGYIFSSISESLVKNHYLEGLVEEYRPATMNELQMCPGNWKYGSYFTTLLIQCRQFLPWATERLLDDGVLFVKKKVNSLDDLAGKCDLLVNCTGLGSRELAADHQLVSIRGQIFKVKADWLHNFIYGDFDTYIIPTGGGLCTVGGSRHYDSYSTTPCRHDGAAIMERATKMLPRLARSPIINTWVGLRPHRHQVRVEPDIRNGLKIVHNYGHGGYGVTTAPGTAMEAVDYVKKFLFHNSKL